MVDGDAFSHVALSAEDVVFLKKLTADLPIVSDICRADLLLYCKSEPDKAIVVAQAMPHSVSPLYEEPLVGSFVSLLDHAELHRALNGNVSPDVVHTVEVRGTTVARQIMPVRSDSGRLIAVLVIDSYWLAHERHRRRSRVFQEALAEFCAMVLRGELNCGDVMTPFGEHDGIVFVSVDRRIQYMSGVASGLYRRLGYRDSLLARRIGELETVDHQMVTLALNERRCVERQDEQFGFTWIRRALPVTAPEQHLGWPLLHRLKRKVPQPIRPVGVFILVHDATEALQTQRELESKLAMVREVHHRVKNNLQVIASLMRMQARRAESEEARSVLEESVNRILSVAVVHEFLSQNAKGTINLLEVAHRILGQVQQGLIDPNKRIRLSVKGSDIWLPAERATQCALVINELVQNAIEHGMVQREEGTVEVVLVDRGEKISIVVRDNGAGLPDAFDLATSANLGLRIVRSMVERDLKGEFQLRSSGNGGTSATVHLNKSALGGA
ncbi:MAG: sensor histidine kinase [Anaerolineae bacterium]